MNCEQVNFILDTKSAAELTAAERQAVDQHFASCQQCREIWDAYGELAALQIPATPHYLRVRIATALAARVARKLHVRRGLFIGTVLLAAAAVAATAVLRFANRSPDSVQTIEEVAPAVQPVVPPAPESPATSDEPAPNSPEPVEPSAAADTVAYPLDRYSVFVVGVQGQPEQAETAATLATCYDAVVEQLRAVGGLNVIAGKPLGRVDDPPEYRVARDLGEAARDLGAGYLLMLISNSGPSCFAMLRDVEAGESDMVDFGWRPDDWRSFASGVAASVRDSLLKDAATVTAEWRAAVLDTTRSHHARLDALLRLRPVAAPPTTLDQASVAVAVQIGMTSPDASARKKAWHALLGVTDPYVVAPLLNALANDAEDDVRAEAALALATFADQPVVKEALTSAAAEVPSDLPASCCITFTVRSAARLALRAGDGPTDAVRGTVLDESLTPRERLLLNGTDGLMTSLDELGDEAARAVFAIGSSAENDEVRSRAWNLLGDVSEQSFVPALLEDLARHPAETVRAAAAWGLRQHKDDPAVRPALERARADSSALVQRRARDVLASLRAAY